VNDTDLAISNTCDNVHRTLSQDEVPLDKVTSQKIEILSRQTAVTTKKLHPFMCLTTASPTTQLLICHVTQERLTRKQTDALSNLH